MTVAEPLLRRALGKLFQPGALGKLPVAVARSARPGGAAPAPAGPMGAVLPASGTAVDAAPAVAVLLLIQTRPGAAVWGWSRVVFGRLVLRGITGLRFARALGSGHDGGFGLRPGFDRQGLIALFDDDAAADDFIDRSAVVAAYHEHAKELLVAKLRASACRGSWGGVRIAATLPPGPGLPIAALTRAAIKPQHALNFWRHSPPAVASLAEAPGCRLAVGLGEAPLLRQATFSLWDSSAAMDAYARRGAHLDAIRAAQCGGYFSESMFVRLQPLRLQGVWQGRSFG